MATELEELVGFLSSPSPPIKKAAVNILRDYTGSEDVLRSLGNYLNVAVPSLSRLLLEKKVVSEPAAEVLVNLSQTPDLSEKMVEMGIIRIVMDNLYKKDCDITHLLVMLLVNLTRSDVGIEYLLQKGDEKMHGLYIMKLVRSFCTSPSENKDDPFEHVASILVNISQNEEGRKLLLDPKRGLFKQIIRQFDSPSPLRKKGVAGTIRNCCFEAENQLQNLLLVSEFLWPALLLPVAGNKIYSEQDTSKMPLELASALSIEREPVTDPEIRIQVLDAIFLLVLLIPLLSFIPDSGSSGKRHRANEGSAWRLTWRKSSGDRTGPTQKLRKGQQWRRSWRNSWASFHLLLRRLKKLL